MHIEDLQLQLGMNVSTNVLQAAQGDLILLKVDGWLSAAQREQIDAKIKPVFAEFGCKFLVLEGGSDVVLIKKPAGQGSEPVVPAE